jgi:hypothetical protein
MSKQKPPFSGTGILLRLYIIFLATNRSKSISLMPQYGKWMQVANVYMPRYRLQTGGGQHWQVEISFHLVCVLEYRSVRVLRR